MRVARTRNSQSVSSDGDEPGSSNPRGSNPGAYPLLRGSACLSCRKRKMKCDAGKPVCQQCLKANRGHDCEYDDGKSKSRTQVMQEKILKQEARIRELEQIGTTSMLVAGLSATSHLSPQPFFDPSSISRTHSPLYGAVSPQPFTPPIDLFSTGLSTPSTLAGSMPGPSSWATAGIDGFDFTHVPPIVADPPSLNAAPQQPADFAWSMSHSSPPQPEPTPAPTAVPASVPGWESDDIPARTRHMLLDIFLKHTHQCGLNIHVPRFLERIHLPLGDSHRPHAALLNAMFLLAAKFSANPALRSFESRFFQRATEAISNALERSDRLLNVVQAECLLAFYLYSNGRLLEGFMHSSAAVRLAVGLDLHKIVSTDISATSAPSGNSQDKANGTASNPATSQSQAGILPPATDAIELGERINAFWMAAGVDRAWSVATGMPIALPDSEHVRTQIDTVWPRSISEFDAGNVSDSDYATLRDLFPSPPTPAGSGMPPTPAKPPSARPDAPETLRAKAIVLFERASRLSASLSTSRGVNEAFWMEFRSVEYAIYRFSQSLPTVRSAPAASSASGDSTTPPVDYTLALVHTLTYVATIQLHHVFAYMDATSHDKCLVAAGGALAVLRDLGEADARMLDPLLGTAWMCVADTMVREQVRLNTLPAGGGEPQAANVGTQLQTIVGAMKQLSEVFPICGFQVSRVQEARQLV